MEDVERQIDRVLMFIRAAIAQSGSTQLKVQHELNWGRSYISQILTKQKGLRLDQVLDILRVLKVDPADFWREVYPRPVALGDREQERWTLDGGKHSAVNRLGKLLVKKGILTATELDEAIRGEAAQDDDGA